MKLLRIIAPSLLLFASTVGFSAHAADVPCEDALRDLRGKEATMTVSAANKSAYEELKAKGIERCNADDDKRADDFFTQAIALMGK